MFDLFRSRGTAVRILLAVLLGLVAVSMLVYLVPNYLDPTYTSGNPVLAEVGDFKIRALEAQQQFQSQISQQSQGQLPPEMLQTYFPVYIDNMIMQRAAVYEAKRMGLSVTNEEVRMFLATQFGQFFPNGVLTDRAGFESLLAQQGITPDMIYEEAYNNQMLRKVRNMILENIVVTPKDVEREYRNKYEKASIRFIGFSSADFRGQVKLTDQEVRQRFEQQQALYNEPEKYSFRVVVLDQERIESQVQMTEQELRNLYTASQDNFRVPERVHARHILVSTEGKSDAEKTELKKKAESLLAQIKNGGDFAEIARNNSEDPGTASNGGDLGFFERGQMLSAEFDAAAFALKPNDVSNVITSEIGYHILQVLEKESARLTPFENVRAELEQELRSRKAVEQVDTVSRNIRSELGQNPANAAEIARKYNGELVTVKEASTNDPIPTLGVTPEIGGVLPGLEPGSVTDVLPVPGGRLVVAVLDAKIPGRPSTFEEVQAQVRDGLINERAQQQAQEKSKEAGDRIKAREDMAAVARSLGLTMNTPPPFTRIDSIDGIGPAAYMEEAFNVPLGTILGPREIQGRTVIAEVTGRTEADMSNLVFEREQLVQSLKQLRAEERDRLWQDSIVAKLTAEGKLKVYQDQIRLIMSQFVP